MLGNKFGMSSEELRRFRLLFDPEYYLYTQPDVREANTSPEEHYCNFGWLEGRNPSEHFNTIWYLHSYEDAIKSGANPLIHYAREGYLDDRPTAPDASLGTSWMNEAAENGRLSDQMRVFLRSYDEIQRSGLFEPEFYRERYAIERGDLIEHYLRHGRRGGHNPSRFFDTAWYLERYDDVRSSGADPFLHFLQNGVYEGRSGGPDDQRAGEAGKSPQPELEPAAPPSPPEHSAIAGLTPAEMLRLAEGFDETYYRRQNPQLDFSAISPIGHYAALGWREGRDPSADFSTKGYLHYNPDVRSSGMNPLLHYVLRGREENRVCRRFQRKPRPGDGASEWRGYGEVWARGETLESREPDVEGLSFLCALKGLLLEEVVAQLDFGTPNPEDVRVSIIIPCLNEELVTVECLQSIAQAMPQSFALEVIIADNASEDPAFAAIGKNPTIKHLRFEKNLGFGPACNAAAAQARGQYLFFLNNDAQISPGCLETLVEAAAAPSVGMVGPKLLCFDGSLQEAGSLLNRDGTGSLVGFGFDPRVPRFNYPRRVEHVSGAAVLIRRALFEDLGGFDDVYAPAYCEDADLSFKVQSKGLSILYEPTAVVAHHLSKTSDATSAKAVSKRQRISRNRQTFLGRWAERLATHNLRTIALYLPQYHPIPENDLWWGKGFTEWTNITKTEPNYVGHNQPRFPADLGYYDLRVPDVLEQQAELARRYGVSGFCYYYYWFDGKRLLEHPLERMLETGKPDFPFCLCWANENWTRRWDGQENDVLLGQSYSEDAALDIIKDFERYFRSERYIRVNGKPLVLIYRIKELPNPTRAMTIWRNHCRAVGIGEICIAMVESFELSAAPEDPKLYGCDISVEFPAHGMVHDEKRDVEKLNFDWTGAVHDYRELAGAFMRRVEAGFPRIRSVLVGWDNTPRHPTRSLILEHATPGAFQAWLEWTYQRTLEQNYGEERIVFINAWNEWCEGSYLEPDRHYGHAYLQAVRNALDSIESGGNAFVV
jgi:GT2 family glycosyltransferase